MVLYVKANSLINMAENFFGYPARIRCQDGTITGRDPTTHIRQADREEGVAVRPINAQTGVAAAPEVCAVDRLMQTAAAALLLAKSQERNRVLADCLAAEHSG